MKLSDYAKKYNITYQTAWNHWKRGLIPNAEQLPTGTVVIHENEKKDSVVIYARVSNSGRRKTDLVRQAQRLESYAISKGWQIEKVIKEVGSGLNDERVQLIKLLSNPPKRILVEHKDRLTRFGFNYLNTLLKTQGTEIHVVNKEQTKDNELMEDMAAIISSFVARLYGRRRSKKKTQAIVEKVCNEQN
jgi:predicted site-specific integrase-resolvase